MYSIPRIQYMTYIISVENLHIKLNPIDLDCAASTQSISYLNSGLDQLP